MDIIKISNQWKLTSQNAKCSGIVQNLKLTQNINITHSQCKECIGILSNRMENNVQNFDLC